MKPKTLFYSSLIAAAAMSTVPAWADKAYSSDTEISANAAITGTLSVNNGATVTQSAGTVSATRLVLNDSDAEVASFYKLTGGVLNITGTETAGTSTTTNAILVGHWHNGTSKLTVSGGVLNAVSGITDISWDSAGTLEISGGEANLYGITLNTYRGNAANVTLSDNGRLNLGAGGLTYGNGTNAITNKTVTLSGGTLGALEDWSSSVAMTVNGNVTIDTTKWVSSATGEGASATGDDIGATITLSGNITQTAGTLSVSGAGTLDLAGTVTLSSAISNSGTVKVSSSSVFVLADALKNEGTDNIYTLITNTDGGSITDWGTLKISNFRQADGTAFSARSSVDVTTDGVATITSVVYNLFWNGGTSGTWDTTATNWGKDSSGGEATTFVSGDNVTFDTSGTVAVAVDSAVTAGTMTVSAGDVTFSGAAVTAKSLEVSSGATVVLTGGKLTTTSGITVGGTLKISSKLNIGGNVTVNSGGTFDVNGSTSDIGSNIGTITLAGGTLTNTGSSVGGGDKQIYTLAVTADSEIYGTGDFGLIGSGYAGTTLALNDKTLTKKGTNTFWLANATVSAGTLKISEGAVDSYGKNINGSAADFVIESAGTLNMRAGTLSAKSISGAGTINFSGAGALSAKPTFDSWTGTVKITDKTQDAFALSNYGTSGSTIELSGFSGYFSEQASGTVSANIKLTNSSTTGRAYAAQITNGNSGTTMIFSGNISGSGLFYHSGAPTQIYKFTGDVSAFTGTLKSTTATFAFEGSSDQTFNGSIVGDGTTGAKITKSGSNKLTLAGTNTSVNASTLTVSGGELEISAGTITLAKAIANSGTVTVGSGAVFVLTDTLKNSGTDSDYTVISSGGTISGWNSLKLSNFRRSDGSEFSVRSTVDVATDGVAKISVVAWNLYWKGGTSGTWNTSTATNWGLNSTGGDDTAFASGDNATFSTSGASVSLGEAITAGTVAVSANTTITATSKNTLTADSISVSAGTLTLVGQRYVSAGFIDISDGATLALGTLGDDVPVSQKLTGKGTVSFTSTHGNTINLGTEFAGTVNISGNLQLNGLSLGSDSAKVNLMTGVHLWSRSAIAPVINQAITFKNGKSKIGGWGSATTSITLAGGLTFDGGTLWVTNASATTAVVLNINKSMTNAEIQHDSGTTNISLSEDSSIKKITLSGGTVNLTQTAGTLTISGATAVSTLAISGGTVNVTGSGKLTGTVSSMSAGTTLSLAGTGEKSAITLSGAQKISGNLTIGNATVDASGSGDIFNYDVKQSQKITLNSGGTLALGSNRQSFNGNVSFELNGGTITGDGDRFGAVDLFGANSITVKSDSEISATLRVRATGSGGSGNVTIAVDDGAVLTVAGSINKGGEQTVNTTRQIIKSGAGSMKLTADNSYFAAGFVVNTGTLVAANEKALGTGTTTVAKDAKLGLVAGTTVSGVTGGVELAKGAKLVIDMTGQTASSAVEDTLALDLVVGSALKYNGNAFDLDCTTLITDGVVVLDNLDSSLTSWVKKLSYADNTLTLTMTVPEPSTFGLLAGVGALAFVAARRRRRAK